MERELILCCASSIITAERTARARALISQGVDWNTLAHLASRQGVMPLVCRYLTSALDDLLPLSAAMRREFHGNALRNLAMARELIRLMLALERGGVEAIALKGPALAVAAYGNLAIRQFSDLDLLVRERDARHAVELLRADGYELCAGYDTDDIGRAGSFEFSLSRPDGFAEVDLHWRLLPSYFPFAMGGEELWQRAVSVEIEGARVRALSPTDQLLHSCAHGAWHGWEALGGICDLAELVRASPPDWNRVDANAERCGARRMLMLGLLLAHELLRAEIPETIVGAAINDRAVVRAAQTFKCYFRAALDEGPGLYQRGTIPLRTMTGAGPRLRFLAARALLPTADDRGLLRLPRALHPIYWLVHPVRVMLQEGVLVSRSLLRPKPSPAAGDVRE